MNQKKRLLSILLMLVIIVNSALPWTPTTVMAEAASNVETITITDASFLKKTGGLFG